MDALSLEDDMSFDSYCIVCDRLIVPPKPVVEVATEKTVKKKSCQGTIRVGLSLV